MSKPLIQISDDFSLPVLGADPGSAGQLVRDHSVRIEPGAARRLHGKERPLAHIETYGCQMNDHDSEIMAGILAEMGYALTADPGQADLLLFNTCAVRETAVEHAFGRIGQLKPLKYTNPGLVIGVCGCVPQVEGQVERMQRLFPHLDLIFGTHNIHQLPDLIARARAERETVVDVWESMGDVVEHLPARRQGNLKAYVTIIYGCDKKCTYCIVPQTRGQELSRMPEHIIAEVQDLGRLGYKEVTLLGQNVDAYGKDLGFADFADLLRLLDENSPGIERIRFTTSHPRDFSQKTIDVIAGSRKICEWLHLPVQSGSSAVLRRMKRSYNREQYLDLIRRVRQAIPSASITTDIIVGFPGETEEQFLETLSLVEAVRFDAAFTFMYSPRAGTPAAEMEDQLSLPEKKSRLQRLMDVQNRISREINASQVGQVVEVLVEGPSKNDPAKLSGRTRQNKVVSFPGDARLSRQLVSVRITEARTWTFDGVVVD